MRRRINNCKDNESRRSLYNILSLVRKALKYHNDPYIHHIIKLGTPVSKPVLFLVLSQIRSQGVNINIENEVLVIIIKV